MSAPASRRDARTPSPDASPRSRKRWPWIVGGAVVLVVAGVGVAGKLVYDRAMAVQDELVVAQQLMPGAKAQIEALELDAATATLADVSTHTSAAVELTDDPLWRLAGILPWIGASVTAATELTAITDDAVRAAEPLIDVAPSLTPENLKPVDGAFPLDAVAAAVDAVSSAADDFGALRERIAMVDTDGAAGQLVSAREQLAAQIGEVSSALDTADTVLPILPSLLGGEGEKRYLLVFQNNAEALGLGGSSASQTLVRADEGRIEIVDQGSSQTYEEELVDVDLPESAFALYGNRYASAMNLTPSRPDWPSDAQIMRAFWQRDVDDAPIHGVASIDPLALARMLEATGPVSIEGVELNSENAVDLLLHEVYGWFPANQVGDGTDAFFAASASAIFDKLSSGDFDMATMITAVGESIDTGSIMYWTDDEQVQGVLDESGSRVTGVLPTDNDTTTTVGVYFRDVSASKIDYFADTTVDVSASCADGEMTMKVTASFRLDLTLEESTSLPSYVRSGSWKGTKYRTQVFMYAPPGFEIAETSVEGDSVREFRTGNVDLGRAVSPFTSTHVPGDTFTVTTVFTGAATGTPVELRTTPMIRPTVTTVNDACGG
ncbi:DUF4012 domain-containing protein [Microbacterium sp. bgisy189]|uniref:DUF4012 domain-containing protein n=1 Tax=Microbacterium sp. bgisy189 TaxID=3413798 RepID=UPI003EBD0B3C